MEIKGKLILIEMISTRGIKSLSPIGGDMRLKNTKLTTLQKADIKQFC